MVCWQARYSGDGPVLQWGEWEYRGGGLGGSTLGYLSR